MTDLGPNITYTEQETTISYPPGNGAKPLIVVGHDEALTEGQIYKFNNPQDAAATLTTGGELLTSIVQMFSEGAQYNTTDNIGIDTIYAVTMPEVPESSDWITVLALIKTIAPLQRPVEAYPTVSDATTLTAISTHLNIAANDGDVRVAVTAVSEETIELMESHIENLTTDRIVIKENQNTMAIAAAKIACTPYQQDPALGNYRSKPEIMSWLKPDLEEMVSIGISPDWNGPNGPEPYMFVTPAFREVEGVRKTSGILHHRLNMDEHIVNIYSRAKKYLKLNNTQTVRNQIEEDLRGYLDIELHNETIESYVINVITDPENSFNVKITGSIGILGSIYGIAINFTMNRPTGNVTEPSGSGD